MSAEKGFTIIEVVMAATLLAFVIVTSLSVLQAGYRQLDTARKTTLAAQVLQSMIEDVRLLSWSGTGGPGGINVINLTNVIDGTLQDMDFDQVNRHQSNSMSSLSPTAARLLQDFRFTRVVSEVEGRTDLNHVPTVRRIVLRARWTGVGGQIHTLEYTTYYARDGLYAYYNT